MNDTDPRKKVYDKLVDQMKEIECYPSFDALVQVEYLRQTGLTNMFATKEVFALLVMHGCDEGAMWISNCLRNKRNPYAIYTSVQEQFELEHGVRSTWVTPEIRKKHQKFALERERRLVEAKLRALDRCIEADEDE